VKRVGRGAKSGATHVLRDALAGFAECPCNEHEQAFLAALTAQAEIYLLVQPAADADGEPAARTAEHDGATWLLCFPDAATAEAKCLSPDDVVGVVPPAVACALVVQAGLGGLHMEAGTADDAWVEVPLEKCVTLAAG
jgi:hypothetical protein